MATKAEILQGLNDQQKDAVVNYNGKIMLEAVPGSGKTHCLVSRCQYLIKEGVKPSRIILFTFTRKAAEEIRSRIAKAIGPDADTMTICTYHSFCCRVLRKFPEYFGRGRNFSIYDEDDVDKILKPIVKEYFSNVGVEPLDLRVVKSYISGFKTRCLSPKEAQVQRDMNSFEKACSFIYESYAEALQRANAVDFNDLTYYAYRLAKAYPEILDYIASAYDYIMSDENQDSNRQNLDFIMLLGSKSHNICVVGDSDQSIYKFRGADIENVISVTTANNFERKFLSTNYRSTATIVEAANNVISNNSSRIPKEVHPVKEQGDRIAVIRCEDSADEALWIANQIEKMKNETNHYSDFAILCRTGAQTRNFEEIFLKKHMPYCIKGVVPFFCRKEVKDIVSYLKFANNPGDIVSLLRIINVPVRGIGENTQNKLVQVLSEHYFDDIIKNEKILKSVFYSKKSRDGVFSFAKTIKNIREMIGNGYNIKEILQFIVESVGYMEYLEKDTAVAETYAQKIANIEELMLIASSYTDVDDFLNSAVLDSSQESEKDDKQQDAVNIMTMHSAKGLEYPTVFIAQATDSSVPYFRSHDSEDAIQEERRLFYVAMTRAETDLCITYPNNVTVNGRKTRQQVSRFVTEIPRRYLSLYSSAQ